MNTANYITVQSFKDYNPGIDTSQYTDTTISGMITQASSWVDNYLGYSLPSETIVNEITNGYVTSDGDLAIFTKKMPIISVEAIDIIKGTDTITLTLTDTGGATRYNIPDSKNRILYPGSELAYSGSSVVTTFFQLKGTDFFTRTDYTAGYTTVPSGIVDAVTLLVKDIITRNLNPSGATRLTQGAITYAFEEKTGESDNVKDAKAILNNYTRMAMFG